MATKKTDVIEIPEIRLELMTITIDGVTPLITERFGEKAKQSIEDAQQGKASSKMKKSPRVPQEECDDKLYILDTDAEGNPTKYGFPAIGVKIAMVQAGGRFTEEPMTKYRGLFSIPEEILEIKADGYTMRGDRVRIGRGLTSVAYRPEFWPWSMDVPLMFSKDFITEEQIVNLLRLAGFVTGIGAWRPTNNGTHGQFEIGKITVSSYMKAGKS